MHVAQIWRYPVKSLGGEQLGAAGVDELGIEGDRAWGLYDPMTGMVLVNDEVTLQRITSIPPARFSACWRSRIPPGGRMASDASVPAKSATMTAKSSAFGVTFLSPAISTPEHSFC